MTPAIVLQSGIGSLGSRVIGEAVLITVAAIVLAYIVASVWPKNQNPSLFGFLAAMGLVGGLAYTGSTGATLAIFLVVVVGAALVFAGVM